MESWHRRRSCNLHMLIKLLFGSLALHVRAPSTPSVCPRPHFLCLSMPPRLCLPPLSLACDFSEAEFVSLIYFLPEKKGKKSWKPSSLLPDPLLCTSSKFPPRDLSLTSSSPRFSPSFILCSSFLFSLILLSVYSSWHNDVKFTH